MPRANEMIGHIGTGAPVVDADEGAAAIGIATAHKDDGVARARRVSSAGLDTQLTST